MHRTAKAAIKECYEKNKSGDPQYQSFYTSMKARLHATVGETHWKKAHDYLYHFLAQKKSQESQVWRSIKKSMDRSCSLIYIQFPQKWRATGDNRGDGLSYQFDGQYNRLYPFEMDIIMQHCCIGN